MGLWEVRQSLRTYSPTGPSSRCDLTAERVRRVIKGVPGAKDPALKEGLGGNFTYCALGGPMDLERFFGGEGTAPSFDQVADYVAYTATGKRWGGPLAPTALWAVPAASRREDKSRSAQLYASHLFRFRLNTLSTRTMQEYIYRRTADLLQAEIGEELVALDIAGGSCFGFNEVATAVWRRLEQPRSFEDLKQSLLAEYDIDSRQCAFELQQLLQELIEKGLVQKS